MREHLNNNPIAQIAIIGVLLVAGGIFLMTTMGGGGEEEASEAPTAVEAAPEAGNPAEVPVESLEAEAPASTSATLAAVPGIEPPAKVVDAYESGATVVLLFVRDGGIDDRLIRDAAAGLSRFPEAVSFIVPAKEIARYTAITGGVGVERVPALVVLTPKDVAPQAPTASVHYGYQNAESVAQAVIDAGYKGPTLDYHP
ncbi:MAG TPA: hypothetical protein VFT79_13565 [Solirubrobacterales bacterium]|nr:hypothetical protein [Solirubrobacterales bacterium]